MNLDPGLLLLPVALLGAIVGSFLNVVIYRLPRGLSVNFPRRSFCPGCGQPVAGSDNVPVLSWLSLGGRCRLCRLPISIRYPLIELLTALVFIMVWDALFVGQVLRGVSEPAREWPVALAYVCLFAGLLACSVMDIEEYLIDIRITNVILAAGVALHALWGGLRPTPIEHRTSPALCLVGAALLAGWVLTLLYARRIASPHDDHPDDVPPTGEAESSPAEAPVVGAWAVWLTTAAVVGCGALAAFDRMPLPVAMPATQQRALLGLFVVLVMLIVAGMQPRPADVEMETAIQAERPRARRTALLEFLWLLPSIVLAAAVFFLLRQSGRAGGAWTDVAGALGPRLTGVLAGAGHATAQLMLAAAIGWFVRIFFTLLFGKEAYGVGDIHIMAAIGAVGGVWLVLISFFVGAGLALIGVAAFVLRRNARAVPFGPWLSAGALIGLWVHDPIVEYGRHTLDMISTLMRTG